MAIHYHVHPRDLFRAHALAAYIARGLDAATAARAAFKAAEELEHLVDQSNNNDLDIE